MDAIPKSGYTLPNRLARITLQAVEKLVSSNGMHALLNMAQLSRLIDNYPPANLERGFDFSDYTALNLALEEMYGERGGRGLALRAGRVAFAEALGNFGALAGTGDAAFKILPLGSKLKIALPALVKIFNTISDQRTSLEEDRFTYTYTIHRNPVCWSRRDEDKPVCYMQVGLLQEALHRISGGEEFRVDESDCLACGDDACRFIIVKEPIA